MAHVPGMGRASAGRAARTVLGRMRCLAEAHRPRGPERDGLRDPLRLAGRTETLLIVDQFEELLTETGQAQRGLFLDLLMALVAAVGLQIVLSLRVDHFNLCRPLSSLFEYLTRDGHDAVLRLRDGGRNRHWRCV